MDLWKETEMAQAEVLELKDKVKSLQETVDIQMEVIERLQEENAKLLQKLERAKNKQTSKVSF